MLVATYSALPDQQKTAVAAPEAGVSPSAADEDAVLMKKVVAGDQKAYRALVERYYRRIFGLAMRMGVSAADAEDIAQDVFVRVWSHKEKWQPGGKASFRTWLYKVATNRTIDYKRKPKGGNLDDVPEQADDAPLAPELISQRQQSDRLREAVATLSPQQQSAIGLFYDQDLSNQEAADIMGVSLNAMESLLKRARKKLREKLKS